MAESLGLHRDGEPLGLFPFQSEMRRRLWWHFLTRDGRAGEDYGLENTKDISDVTLPLNVDDADLYPGMKELPPAKRGWTPMAFSLINIDLVRSMQKLASIATSSSPSSFLSEDVRAQIINETRERIEERLELCNPVIPQHRLTLLCSRFLLRKLDFITRLQWLSLKPLASHDEFATEENLIEALEILTPRLVREDDLLKQFAWAREAYPQYYVTMYVLQHLCVKPEGPSVDRAWEAVELVFQQWDEFSSGFGSKSAVLAALRAKAVSAGEKIQNRNLGGDARNSDSGLGLERGYGPSGTGAGPAYPLGNIDSNEFCFDINSDAWPNWATLAQGFQLVVRNFLVPSGSEHCRYRLNIMSL
jgi:Fungal specific transcription factor domain